MGKKDDKEKGSKSSKDKGESKKGRTGGPFDVTGDRPGETDAERAPSDEVEAEPFDPAREPGPTFDAPPPPRASGESDRRARSLEENLWPTLCHLSPLLGWVFAFSGFGVILMPFLWIAAPLVIWQMQRSDARIAEHAREALNFQLNVVALSTLMIVTCILLPFGLLLPVAAVVLSCYAALQASEGRSFRYPLIYRIVRD